MRIEFTLDCADPRRLAEFWRAAFRFRTEGTIDDRYVALAGHGVRLTLQKVAEPKAVKNRMHIDVLVEDPGREVARLEGLGATRLTEEPLREFGQVWFVMADPEGNEFCLAREPA
ncbi:MAG TPA: VOC family protein [Nocardioidaceae bacterium]|jgi:predicted enzyme related to lactoylglutathione lyase